MLMRVTKNLISCAYQPLLIALQIEIRSNVLCIEWTWKKLNDTDLCRLNYVKLYSRFDYFRCPYKINLHIP